MKRSLVALHIMIPCAYLVGLISTALVSGAAVVEPDLPPGKPHITKQLLRDAISVFSLTIAQERSLILIYNKFPDLREPVLEAQTAFDRAYRSAIRATDTCLQENHGAEWETLKEQLVEGMDQLDDSSLTRSGAIEYVETVKRRAQGEIPPRIYTVLAALDPRYLQHPHLEFANGYKREFKSDGSGKAAGLELVFEYPMSWDESEGRRPHILRKFGTHDSFASAMLVVKKLTPEGAAMPIDEALIHLSSEEYLTHEMDDAEFLRRGKTTIASQPSAFVDYRRTVVRTLGQTRIEIKMRARMYFVIYRGVMITIGFNIGDSEGRTTAFLENEFKRREPLFDLMAHSLDIYNKYR